MKAKTNMAIALAGVVLTPRQGSVVTRNAMASLTPECAQEPAKGLVILRPSDTTALMPWQAKFPMAVTQRHVSKTGKVSEGGKFTGKLINISDLCRQRYGLAWNEAHRNAVKEREGIDLKGIIKPDDKKALQEEMDKLRAEYQQAGKANAAALLSREDIRINGFATRPTSKGFSFNIAASLDVTTESAVARLQRENAAIKAELAAAQALLPKGAAKRIHNKVAAKGAAIDVESTREVGKAVEQTAPKAPGEPVTA